MILFDYKDDKVIINIDNMLIGWADYDRAGDNIMEFTKSFCDFKGKDVKVYDCHFVGIVSPMFYLKLAIKSARWHLMQWYKMKKAYAQELFRKVAR
ncbi:MAG: hypothetical protein WC464_00265 [Bdellovibrionales bacterium]|jgi:hypothetical protein